MSDRIEQIVELAAPPTRVWQVLTDHREFGAWFRVRLDGPFQVGSVATGQITHPGYEHLSWRALIERMDSEQVFAFSWEPAGDAMNELGHHVSTLVEFTLIPSGPGTRLLISESGFDALPEALRDEAYRRNASGWEQQAQNILAHVDG
ncbi:MAG: SRPBCC family protein [Pseudomonadales bacterium]